MDMPMPTSVDASRHPPEKIHTFILDALAIAHQAVTADTAGDFLVARLLYRDCADRLDSICPFVTSDYQRILLKYSTIYSERCQVLKTARPPKEPESAGALMSGSGAPSDHKFSVPVFPVSFTEQKFEPTALTPLAPENPILRPYWLLKVISVTMLNGGYVTDSLYVPKDVWFQPGARVFGVAAKTAFCEGLSNNLLKLSKANPTNLSTVNEELDRFLDRAEILLETLAKTLPSMAKVSEQKEQPAGITGRISRLGTSITRLVSVSSKAIGFSEGVNEKPYVPWVIGLSDHSQFLITWCTFFQKENASTIQVYEKLERISSFMYSAVCAFLLQDMQDLLDRYMKRSRESFSRLFPKNYTYKL